MQLDASKHFRVFGASKVGDISKSVVNTRWVLAWKMADGQKCVEARQAAEGFRDPNLKDGNVDASGRVSLPPSHRWPQESPCSSTQLIKRIKFVKTVGQKPTENSLGQLK